MKLTDLDASFVGAWKPQLFTHLDSLLGAQGVLFQCPTCQAGLKRGEENGKRFVEGDHYILCWFVNPQLAERVPDSEFPGPGRWTVSGTSLDDLTLSPSVNATVGGGCAWHGWVRNGDAT